MMPTIPKLVAATCLAILAYIVTTQVIATMPEKESFGKLIPSSIIISLLCGWIFIGRRVGETYVIAISTGLSGMAAAVFWVLLAQSGSEMLRLSLRRRFDGPMEAIVGVFQIAYEFGAKLAQTETVITLLVGGIIAGVLAEFAARRWS